MSRITIIFFVCWLIGSCSRSQEYKYYLNSNEQLEYKFTLLKNNASLDTVPIVFKFDTLTNDDWDTAVILTPYIDLKTLEKRIHVDLYELRKTHIISDEISNVIAFVKDHKLTHYLELYRDSVDFHGFTDKNRVIGKENQFVMRKEKNQDKLIISLRE